MAIHVKRNVFRHSPGNQSREISFRLILRVGKGSDPKYITPRYIKLILLQEKRMMDWLEKQNAGVQITILTIPLIAVILFGAIMEWR